jgi:hypothetical protein
MTERPDDPLRKRIEEFWLERALGLSMAFLLTCATILIAAVALLLVLT